MRVQAAHVAGAEAVLVRSQLPEAPFLPQASGGSPARMKIGGWMPVVLLHIATPFGVRRHIKGASKHVYRPIIHC